MLFVFCQSQDFSNSNKEFYTITMSMYIKENQKGFFSWSEEVNQKKIISLENIKSPDFYMIEYKLIRNLCLKDIDPIAGK